MPFLPNATHTLREVQPSAASRDPELSAVERAAFEIPSLDGVCTPGVGMGRRAAIEPGATPVWFCWPYYVECLLAQGPSTWRAVPKLVKSVWFCWPYCVEQPSTWRVVPS